MDETTVRVLDPGRGRTKTGYMWTLMRDERPWSGADPPGVVYRYAPSVLDPAVTPFVLMPDPGVRVRGGPCQLWLVTMGSFGYHPTELEMASFEEAERACDDANLAMGWSPEAADEVILASMGGGTT